MSLEWCRPDYRGQSRAGGCRGNRSFHSKDINSRVQTLDGRAKTEPESYDGCSGPSSSKFPTNSEVPVKSSRPKSKVPAAALGLPPFPSASSLFPHPLLTLHSRYFDLILDIIQFLHSHLRKPSHWVQLNPCRDFPSCCSCLFSFLPCCLLGIASSALLLPVVCRRLYLVPLFLRRDRSRDRTKHLQPPVAT